MFYEKSKGSPPIDNDFKCRRCFEIDENTSSVSFEFLSNFIVSIWGHTEQIKLTPESSIAQVPLKSISVIAGHD